MRTLEDVLRYENKEVVRRFAAGYGVSLADAEDVFLETKRWLRLCANVDARVPLLSEARAIDLMWHTFPALSARLRALLRRVVRGVRPPLPARERRERSMGATERQLAVDREGATRDRREALRKACEVVCDRLGASTLAKWCEEFPRRFHFS